MTTFTGVLAVLHTPTTDGRQLDEPGPDLTRPLPLPLVRPGEPGIGRINRVWQDGNLLRYAGTLDDEHPDADAIATGIRAGRLVGMLDADDAKIRHQNGNLFSDRAADTLTVMSGWRVMAVTLMPSEGKAWPEVSLTLDA
ncbi:hypothetical protein [Streptomyces sp. NPDC093591]|uniref:hypothetical protein n=1 Tax=Streptomyces sp. NPDC093591 TaxID=3366044 RepID=UPI003813ED74